MKNVHKTTVIPANKVEIQSHKATVAVIGWIVYTYIHNTQCKIKLHSNSRAE